jgi:hypothetical protein
MKFIHYLNEEYYTSFKTKTFDSNEQPISYNVEIYKNPSKGELKDLRKELMKTFDYSFVRTLEEPKTKTIFVFSSKLLHYYVEEKVKDDFPMHTPFIRGYSNISPYGVLV